MAEVQSHLAADFPLVKSEEVVVAYICISPEVSHHNSTGSRVNDQGFGTLPLDL